MIPSWRRSYAVEDVQYMACMSKEAARLFYKPRALIGVSDTYLLADAGRQALLSRTFALCQKVFPQLQGL